jgi:glycerol-3-phosphate dehydrogenase (NAD(P)+)
MVFEGVRTTRAALSLAERHGVELPLAREVARILFENKRPEQGLADLMGRLRRSECAPTEEAER